MSGQPYSQPPITEAVIEIRFASPLDARDVIKSSSDFAKLYPREQAVKNVGWVLGVPMTSEGKPTAQLNTEETVYRRVSLDLAEILVLGRQVFSMSQLAPYPGWDVFFERFKRDWVLWKKRVGYRKIIRIGVRYINRIDIPTFGNTIIEETNYLNVYPHIPKNLGPTMIYGVQAILHISDIRAKLTLNSSTVPSPLLNHVAFLFDQDIAREIEPPQRDEEVFDLLNRIRNKKNEVFEACVTDRARELFRK